MSFRDVHDNLVSEGKILYRTKNSKSLIFFCFELRFVHPFTDPVLNFTSTKNF
jgi:hypothetical protein